LNAATAIYCRRGEFLYDALPAEIVAIFYLDPENFFADDGGAHVSQQLVALFLLVVERATMLGPVRRTIMILTLTGVRSEPNDLLALGEIAALLRHTAQTA
jgi:hypothetical protein